jgi:GT2 family glycosyltransferase
MTHSINYVSFPQFQVIANEVNVGFARANNQVFKDVTGRFVLILNPDTVVIEGALRKMIEFLVNHPDVGMVGPRLCYPNDEVQATCARPFVTLAMSLFYALRLLQFAIHWTFALETISLSI